MPICLMDVQRCEPLGVRCATWEDGQQMGKSKMIISGSRTHLPGSLHRQVRGNVARAQVHSSCICGKVLQLSHSSGQMSSTSNQSDLNLDDDNDDDEMMMMVMNWLYSLPSLSLSSATMICKQKGRLPSVSTPTPALCPALRHLCPPPSFCAWH